MEEKLGRHDDGTERQERAEERARNLIAQELKRRGWKGSELERGKKGDWAKAKIASACGGRRRRLGTGLRAG